MSPKVFTNLDEHSFGYFLIYLDKDHNIVVRLSMENEVQLRALASKAIDVGNDLLDKVSIQEEVNDDD